MWGRHITMNVYVNIVLILYRTRGKKSSKCSHIAFSILCYPVPFLIPRSTIHGPYRIQVSCNNYLCSLTADLERISNNAFF
jgi:hypothetical protein